MSRNPVAAAVQLGLATGLRSFTGAATFAQSLANAQRNARGNRVHDILAEESVATALQTGAVLELGADKLPGISNRIDAGPLLWRAAIGGVLGYAVVERRRDRRKRGRLALIGAAAAVAGAFAGYATRRILTSRGAPDWSVALAEDALAITLATRGTRAARGGIHR